MNKKGFTLIELLAVLVILAIIALITIPIVLKTISNSEEKSEMQSIDGYARAIENYIQNDMMLNPGRNYSYYNDKLQEKAFIDDLKYKGNKVTCSSYSMDENGKLILTCCKVEGGTGVGYNYTENKVSKNEDSSCTSKEDNNNEYHPIAYNIGDTIMVADELYYVIADSDETQEHVTALKEKPLTVEEVNTYGAGHVNLGSKPRDVAYDIVGDGSVGGVAYYSRRYGGCGYDEYEANRTYSSNCKTAYEESDARYIVNAWAQAKFVHDELLEVDGYSARLIKLEEQITEEYEWCAQYQGCHTATRLVEKLRSSNYSYWTMTPENQSNSFVKTFGSTISSSLTYRSKDFNMAIRPVINVDKSKTTKIES